MSLVNTIDRNVILFSATLHSLLEGPDKSVMMKLTGHSHISQRSCDQGSSCQQYAMACMESIKSATHSCVAEQ